MILKASRHTSVLGEQHVLLCVLFRFQSERGCDGLGECAKHDNGDNNCLAGVGEINALLVLHFLAFLIIACFYKCCCLLQIACALEAPRL